MLLADKVKLSGDVTVTGIERQPGLLQVLLHQDRFAGRRHPHADLRRPAAAAPAMGGAGCARQETRVSLFNVQLGERFDDKLFGRHRPAYQGGNFR